MVIQMINSIIDHIYEAKYEAMVRGIEANAVAINDRLYFSKISNDYGDIPIVCGLKCVYTNELPEDVGFAVFHASNAVMTKDEMIASLEKKNEELHRQLDRVYEIIGQMIDR